jgi:hypothetical protein
MKPRTMKGRHMTKTEFNSTLKKLTTNGRLDLAKVTNLSDSECDALVRHIVRNRGAVVKELIRPSIDMAWLRCMGYLYEVQGDEFQFLCTCENTIIAAQKPKPVAKTIKPTYSIVLDDGSTRIVEAKDYAASMLPESVA